MKQFLLAIATIATIVFSGCSKDEIDDLAGTTWRYTETYAGTTESLSLSFSRNGQVTLSADMNSAYVSVIGSYIYTAPNVTMIFTIEGIRETLKGTVSGRQMAIYNEYGEVGNIFIKD